MEFPNSNPEIKNSTKINFSITNKRLPSYYISSIPQGLDFISVREFRKPRIKGEANGFKFYAESFSYVSAMFNINESNVDEAKFLFKIETMFSTLHCLNKKPARSTDVLLILKHIKQYSNYVFDVPELYFIVRNFQYNRSLVKIKSRNYIITEYKVYKEKIDFLNAFNKAYRMVNSNFNLKELFRLFEERITNNDYAYLNEVVVWGHKSNNLLVSAMVRKFNLLCTGLQRKGRKQVNSEPLYCNSLKRLTLKSISLKPQQQNAFMQKGIIVYERELKAFIRLINNRNIAQQMFLILAELSGLDVELEITPDVEVQNQLKADLINVINRKASTDREAEASEFDRIYKKPFKKEIPLNYDLSNEFDTDMKNSIFNQLSLEQVLSMDDEFLYDYMNFHNGEKIKGRMNFGIFLHN
jgi:hypothetical protein